MIPTLRRTIAFSAVGCFLWLQPAPAAGSARPTKAAATSPDSKTSAPGESERSGTNSPAEEQPTIEQAREAFLQGRVLIAEGKWTEAEEQFLFAVRVKNTPGLRYYIGFCREKQGLFEEALFSYQLAAELLETQKAPDVDQIVPVALERVTSLLPVVFLFDVPAGASLKVDGAERPLTQQFQANPGSHRVLIEKDGYSPFAATVDLVAGQKSRIQVTMEPLKAVAETPVSDERAPSKSHLKKILFWSSTGIAVAGLGAGVTGAMLFSSTKREISTLNEEADEISDGDEDACNNPTAALERICEDLARGAKRKNTMGNLMLGGFIGAGVGTVGAVVTHFFWPEAPVRVEVGLSEGASAFLLSGQF